MRNKKLVVTAYCMQTKGGEYMKRTLISTAIGAVMMLAASGSAFAAANPQGTGQPGAPNESCGSGNATNQPNGFLTAGFANAAANYAGSPGTPSAANAHSTHAIAQYDVACYQQTANH
jgi:hypothetical protein